MQKKIVKIIVKLALIFIAGMIVSVGMTVINHVFFDGTIDKRVLSIIYVALGGVIGIIASKDAWKN
ncbi:hypothetical protein DW886_15845 [Enterocloster aldenensis]|uniref:hypothetical protein n=1 Tax=Enterocloster aldenensis TaxID=358742 RepID=UPI000E50F681|nr:hypothetical protein DW886_15845 [Enterocloster aldenensis]